MEWIKSIPEKLTIGIANQKCDPTTPILFLMNKWRNTRNAALFSNVRTSFDTGTTFV
jgi:hypothetical protein